MTIDTSGKWWVGSEASDVLAYIEAYEAEGYAVDQTRLCVCRCGSDEFALEADREDGCARRTCVRCGDGAFICDSDEIWGDAEPQSWICTECGSTACNIGVGFSLYDAHEGSTRDVRWISVGNRCTGCGTLGCFVDWKVGYGPSDDLLNKV